MRKVSFWHLKALGYCNRQMRRWCKAHGVSWRELRTEGIEVDRLLALDNGAMAHRAVAFAEASGWSPVPVPATEDNRGCV
ncbi:hypothetical protein [Desulfobulbus sp.]|uniref:hypothetical protein n=1 Tax=Desulfobulbus sp. TaxID=895 RepID=UPI00286F5701|nr:hypothetical protein [Desulfobulbus sp.]